MSGPADITAGPDGNLWFTAFNGTIGEVTTAGAITPYTITGATATANFRGITSARRQALVPRGRGRRAALDRHGRWRPDHGGPRRLGAWRPRGDHHRGHRHLLHHLFREGRESTSDGAPPCSAPSAVPPTGSPSGPTATSGSPAARPGAPARRASSAPRRLHPVARVGSVPKGITTGPDGALWFTEAGINSVGRVTTTGQVTQRPAERLLHARRTSSPPPTNALWVTCFGNNALVRDHGRSGARPRPAVPARVPVRARPRWRT